MGRSWRAPAVRKAPSWPRNRASPSLPSLCSHRNARANSHLLSRPHTLRARAHVHRRRPDGRGRDHPAADSPDGRRRLLLRLSGPAPGCLRALSVFYSKSLFYGVFVWAHRALNSQKRRFPARAVGWPSLIRNFGVWLKTLFQGNFSEASTLYTMCLDLSGSGTYILTGNV